MTTNEEYLDRLLQAALHPELNLNDDNEPEVAETETAETETAETETAEAADIAVETEMESLTESEIPIMTEEGMGSIAAAREAEFKAMSEELSFASLEAELQSELDSEIEDMDLDAMEAELSAEPEGEQLAAMAEGPELGLDSESFVSEEEPETEEIPEAEEEPETAEMPEEEGEPETAEMPEEEPETIEMPEEEPEGEQLAVMAEEPEETLEEAEASLDALLGELGVDAEDSAEEDDMPSLDLLMGELGSDLVSAPDFSNEQEESADSEDGDISNLLDMLSDEDGELAEINDLLKKSDNHEMVEDNDMLALLGGAPDEEEEVPVLEPESVEEVQQEEVLEEIEEKSKKKKWGKKKKDKKNKDDADKESTEGEKATAEEEVFSDDSEDVGEAVAFIDSLSAEEGESIDITPIKEKDPPKPGFFRRMMKALLEEEEEEEVEEGLEDLEEEILGKKAKKEKKKKGKKGKKGGSSNDEILDEMNDEGASDKKGKKKKPKKEKPPKEKKVKEVPEPGKKLPKKMIIRIFVLCFSIMAVVILFSQLTPRFLHLADARNDFYRGNYEDAYEGLVGRELSDGDTILLQKAKILAQLSRKTEAYEAYLLAGDRAKALNELLEGVAYYEDQADMIAALGIQIESDMAYSSILLLLQGEFSISEAQAHEIIALDPIDYTYMVRGLAGGDPAVIESIPAGETEDITSSQPQEGTDEPEPAPELEDVLPGELD